MFREEPECCGEGNLFPTKKKLTVCSLIPPATTSPLAGLTGMEPEEKTKPLAMIPWAKEKKQKESKKIRVG